MRQLFYFTIFLSLVIASCQTPASNPVDSGNNDSADKALADTSPLKKFTYDVSLLHTKFDSVPISIASAMIFLHKKDRIGPLLASLGRQDTRFINYKIDDLITYLVDAKNNLKADSIRIYFGVHPSNDVVVERRGLQTTLFIPTLGGKDIIVNDQVLMHVFDEGQLCPPPFPCGRAGAILMNTADGMTQADVNRILGIRP